MFPFIPDTFQIESFQTYNYQSININACFRYELASLPFLTPEQIDTIMKYRPYKDWEDMLRKTGFKDYELEYLKRFIYFGGERFSNFFVKVYDRGFSLSSKGKNEGYSYSLYLSSYDTSFFIKKEGFVSAFVGNSKIITPLGFAGSSGFYTNYGDVAYVYNAKPSLGIGLGKMIFKLSESGMIGGYISSPGGLLITKKDSLVGGISFLKFGKFYFETGLSKSSFGFGIKGYAKGGGFSIRYFNGESFWDEGSQKSSYSLWYRYGFKDLDFRIFISSYTKRFSLWMQNRDSYVRVEYFQVPRFIMKVNYVEGGICEGCTYVGLRYRDIWVRFYSFGKDGIKFYEDAYSSRVFTSKKGFRLSAGFKYKNFGGLIYKENENLGWILWGFIYVR